jgi:glycosyltransferase involved in cell wall biosynthesis
VNRSPNNPTAPKVALLGPLPPPYGGYASYVMLLRGSALAERFGYYIIDTSHARLGGGLSKVFGMAHLAVRDVWRFWRATRIRSIRLIHILGAFYPQRRFLLQAAFFRWAGRKAWSRIYDIRAGAFIEFAENSPKRVQRRLGEVIRSAEAVTVEGRPYVDYIERRWGVRAVHMPAFVCWSETGGRYNVSEEVADGPLRVVFAGRVARAKGVVELAEAVAKIHPRREVRLDYVGEADVEAREAIERLIREHRLEGVITLWGSQPRQAFLDRLAAGHVYALPTYHVTEGHPNAMTEAMAMGLPVVTCDQGFCADVVSGGAGVLVPQRDSGALARVLEELAGDPDRRRRMGEAARRRARERFSDETMLPRWADLYERLIGAKA